jgi:citrate/tricarballylate utilization protein
MSEGTKPNSTYLDEAERVMTICNACRYCEGFCAVFPAMEKRMNFSAGDLRYLANLCHDCQECYYACQYAPPHEFNLNVPKTLTGLRRESYREYAWPGFLAELFSNTTITVFFSLVIVPIIFLLAGILVHGMTDITNSYPDAEGSFYRLVSHSVMSWGFGIVGLFVLIALGVGWCRMWKDISSNDETGISLSDMKNSLFNSLKLRYLGSSGEGCTYPLEQQSNLRRVYHHFTFYGFMLCFAATSVATVYHYLFDWQAPYPFLSIPVILGTLGGLGLIIGPVGLLHLKSRRDPELVDGEQTEIDVAFLLLLLLISITGLLLLFLRETQAMGILLLVHLGLVMGLFLTIPYGKFVHGLYRFGALLHFAIEERGK